MCLQHTSPGLHTAFFAQTEVSWLQTVFCDHTTGLLRYSEPPVSTPQFQLGTTTFCVPRRTKSHLCPHHKSPQVHTVFFCLYHDFPQGHTPQVPEVLTAFYPHRKSPRGHTAFYAHITWGHVSTCLPPHHHMSSWEQTAFFFFLLLYHTACGILVPQPGIKPVPRAVEARSLNHWTAGEVPEQTLSASTPHVVLSTHTLICTACIRSGTHSLLCPHHTVPLTPIQTQGSAADVPSSSHSLFF